MASLVLPLVLLAIVILYHLAVEKPREKLNDDKVYFLTRKDLRRVAAYGMIFGIAIGPIGTVLGRMVSVNTYLYVFVCGLVFLIAEIVYKKVAVPFLSHREVSDNR